MKFPKATDLNVTVFIADADPTTRTFPLRKDSDGGGLPDGVEDYSHNGKLDLGETDPGMASDDGAIDGDLDGDSLDNATELLIGTNPLKADTDGDGLLDPSEVGNPQAPIDTDGDKIIDALDIDSDNHGLQDKDETGLTGPPVLPQGVLDSDGDGKPDFRDTDSDNDTLSDGDEVFKYHTNRRLADSDGGGLTDDVEVLQMLSDPLDARDDTELIESGARLRGTTPLSCNAANPQGKAGLLLLLLPAALLLRRRKKLLFAAILLLLPTLAWATVQEPDVTGFRFNVDGQGILTLDAAKQVAPQQLTVGVQMQYAVKPLVSASETQVFRSLVDYRAQLDVGMSMRLFDNLTLCAHLPVAIAQDGTLPSRAGPESGPITQTTGIADAVVTLKYIFRTEGERRLGFGLLLPVSLPTGTPEQYLGRPGATVAPTALLSAQFGQWRVVGNLGVRLQDETKAFNLRDGSVVRFGAAGSWNPTVKLWTQQNIWFDASLMHETPLAAPFANGANERFEAALAFNVPIDDGIYLTLGSSFGLWPGNGVPAYRPMLLVRYAP